MRKFALWAPLLALLYACSASLPGLPGADVWATGDAGLAKGVKEALELGSVRAATQLSQAGGYSKSPLYRIELPENIQPVAGTLRQFGMGKHLDRVETLMNQGAEQAANEAKALFVEAVRNMSIEDALGIIRGSNTAATEYFRAQTEQSLRTRYQPIMQQNLRQLGFYEQYKSLLSLYQNLPVRNKPNLDLEDHAINQSLNALFRQVAEEEKLIRADPFGRGSQLIGAAFGNQ